MWKRSRRLTCAFAWFSSAWLRWCSPLTVRGNGFHAKEKVRVTVNVGSVKQVRVVRATAAGVFTVELSNMAPYDRCNDALLVRAAGTIGDTAVLKLPQRACPPSP